jgi:hypothetical protein
MIMIKDFGAKIKGAAKDRWGGFVKRMGPTTDQQISEKPLSETFPEPNYKALIKDGVDPWVLSFIRSARDCIPQKPRKKGLFIWVSQVKSLRGLCSQLLDGSISADGLRDRITDSSSLNDSLRGRIALYQRFGHDKSFKNYQIQSARYTSMKGVEYDPARTFWSVENRKERLRVIGLDMDDVLDQISVVLEREKETPETGRRIKLKLYHLDGKPEVHICRNFGKNTVSLASFPDIKSAKKAYAEDYDEYVSMSERMRNNPAERGVTNRDRTGFDRRGGADVTPESFTQAFGFRGVQFGNYVEKSRRQMDLNDAYDAFMDLADVVGCEPSALSLDGRLALAFGARGRGGIDAAAAHYEPVEVVINLTKKQGAGSLAHEWFHAVDNAIGRKTGRVTNYASNMGVDECKNLTLEDRREIGGMSSLTTKIIARTDILKRSQKSDKFRATAYWGTREEISARCFEAWVIDALATEHGVVNDYLANVIDEDVYRAEAALLGLPADDNRYPYPTVGEMADVSAIFEAAFREAGPVSRFLRLMDDMPDFVADPTSALRSRKGVTPAVSDAPSPPVAEEWNMNDVDF